MADVHNAEQRSRNMASIRGKNTRPEMIVRALLHRLGFRFRIHRPDLPGRPDIVFPSRRKIILVHGCFWHLHDCRYGRVRPSTRADFWEAKRTGNVSRDQKIQAELRHLGWDVLVIWECLTLDQTKLHPTLLRFLDPSRLQNTFE